MAVATLWRVADQTRASIDIVNLPMIGMFKRTAERTIIDGALKGLKRRVEN